MNRFSRIWHTYFCSYKNGMCPVMVEYYNKKKDK